jgi:hypothetical protein
MKWPFLLGNVAFALALALIAVLNPATIYYALPIGTLSAFMAYVIWSDCRGEWLK